MKKLNHEEIKPISLSHRTLSPERQNSSKFACTICVILSYMHYSFFLLKELYFLFSYPPTCCLQWQYLQSIATLKVLVHCCKKALEWHTDSVLNPQKYWSHRPRLRTGNLYAKCWTFKWLILSWKDHFGGLLRFLKILLLFLCVLWHIQSVFQGIALLHFIHMHRKLEDPGKSCSLGNP